MSDPTPTRQLSRARLFGFLFLLLTAAPAFAQHYQIRTYREQDGLIANAVFNAAQDTLGNLWFGTRNGLCVYNGSEWTAVQDPDGIAPQGSGLVSIDNAGVVWWVPRDLPLRVMRRDGVGWVNLPKPADEERMLGVAGVTSWSLADGRSCLATVTRTGRVAVWDGVRWRRTPLADGEVPCYGLSRYGDRLLIASERGVLQMHWRGDPDIRPVDWDLPAGPSRGFCLDAATGHGWVVGGPWCARIENEKVAQLYPLPELPEHQVFLDAAVAESPEGTVYIVETAGIHAFHPDWGLEMISPAQGIASDGGLSVLVDREHNIWIPSSRGVSKIISRRFACFNRRHGLQGDEVSAILERRDGTVVLGHRTGLTFMEHPPLRLSFGDEDWPEGRISDLAEDANGRLWFAANRKQLGYLADDGSVVWQRIHPENVIAAYTLVFHSRLGLIVGTNAGVYRETAEGFREVEFASAQEPRLRVVRRMIELSDGSLAVVAHPNVLILWDGVTDRRYDVPAGADGCYSLIEPVPGEIWIGTGAGVYRLVDDRVEKIEHEGFRIDRPVYSLLRTRGGDTWFGTDNGVFLWNGRKLRRLTSQEGLLGYESNRDALIEDERGRIWIGTDSGLSVYRAEFDLAPTVAPVLTLTAIEVNGELLPIDQPIEHVGPIGSLDLHFRAPTYCSEDPPQFRARILGDVAGELPLKIHAPGTLPLTNVPAGDFRIQVQARSPDGRESGILTSPRIHIVPPLLQRWYVKTAGALVAALSLWLFFALVASRRHRRLLEAEVQKRTADLQLRGEAALRETERLTAVLQSITEGVVVIDERARAVLFNEVAVQLVPRPEIVYPGIPLGEALPSALFIDPEHRAIYERLLADPLGVQIPSEPIALRGPEEPIRWIEVSGVPIGGPQRGLVLAVRDITERRRQEQEKRRTQKLESLGLLAGGIAHDFNNLLTIMLGNLTLIETSPSLGAFEKGFLGKIRHATERARSLTRQLLTFARGGGPVREPADLAPILRGAVSFGLSGSNVTCELDLPEDLWWSEVDADQIHQVFNNLVINAFQAMPEGGSIGIKARNRSGADGRAWVRIEVRDHGMGIPEEDQARIFDPYYTTKEGGSGLGLAIAHSIIEKHGGRLGVESALGAGSTFRVTLPACETPSRETERTAAAAAAGPESEPEPVRRHRILVMDDEEEIRRVLENMLVRFGHECEFAAQGEEAVRMFRRAALERSSFDMVILDLTIPGGMGGLETFQELRRIDPEVRAVVTSGYSADPVLADHRRFGFHAILRKPFTLDDVRRAVENAE